MVLQEETVIMLKQEEEVQKDQTDQKELEADVKL
jgi:hypothetical protein